MNLIMDSLTPSTARYVIFISDGDSYQVAGFSDDKNEALVIYWREVVVGHKPFLCERQQVVMV